MARRLYLLFLVVTLGLVPFAQPGFTQTVRNNILILDPERLYSGSAYGLRVAAELEIRAQSLADENRRIEQELQVEEKALSEERPTLDPAEFRLKADAFDEKVEEIRARQGQKQIDLGKWVDKERQRFFQAGLPALLALAKELGAAVILDSRTVFLSSDSSDVTGLAIDRINADIGDTLPTE